MLLARIYWIIYIIVNSIPIIKSYYYGFETLSSYLYIIFDVITVVSIIYSFLICKELCPVKILIGILLPFLLLIFGSMWAFKYYDVNTTEYYICYTTYINIPLVFFFYCNVF